MNVGLPKSLSRMSSSPPALLFCLVRVFVISARATFSFISAFSYRDRPMPLRRHLFLGMFLNAFLIGTGVVSMGLLTATFKLPPTVLFAQADIE